MSKLKPCPFCGKKPFYIEWVACVNPQCQLVNTYFVPETWNTRPIEDKLQARLDAVDTAAWDNLKAELEQMRNENRSQRDVIEHLEDTMAEDVRQVNELGKAQTAKGKNDGKST